MKTEQNGLKKWRTLKDAFDNLPENVEKHYIEFPEKRLKYYRMLQRRTILERTFL